MISITFNAFSFLQPKLKKKNIKYTNATLELPDGTTPRGLMKKLGLGEEEVEAVFVNNKVVPVDSLLQNNDRVAFVPPGTPGPYRVLLGIINPNVA